MSCRHQDGDPACTTKNPDEMRKMARAMSARWDPPSQSPDADEFDIIRIEEFASYLIAEVVYPSCAKCSYEGHKLIVWKNQNMRDAVRWKKVDPHFRPEEKLPDPKQAPPPLARFPATPEGWVHAKLFAQALDAESRRRP